MKEKGGDLEESIRQFRALAQSKRLQGEQRKMFKKLATKFKEGGFSNEQISQFTGGAKSAPTIKVMTQGVEVEDPSVKEDALNLLVKMVEMGLTLEDIRRSIAIDSQVKAKGGSLEAIASLLGEADEAKISVKDLCRMQADLTDSKLSVAELKEALSTMSELRPAGITVEGLKAIAKLSKTYGSFNQVVEAVNAYGSLDGIKAESEKASAGLEELQKEIKALQPVLDDLRLKREEVDEALKLHAGLVAGGFDKATLEELDEASKKYGGPKGVFEAINRYASLVDLKAEADDWERKASDEKSNFKKYRAEHAHLQSVIGMCETLLFKLKFSPDAMTQVYHLAKNYGEPMEVIKAISAYGKMKSIERGIKALSSQRGQLEIEIGELSDQARGLKAQTKHLVEFFGKQLKPITKGMKDTADKLSDEATGAMNDISARCKSDMLALENAQDKALEGVSHIEAMTQQISSQFEKLMAKSEEVGKEVGKQEAMMPIFKLLEEPEGKPEEVIPPLQILLLRLRKWAESHKPKNSISFQRSLDDFEKQVKEGW